ncbi:MAG: DsbA family protein [Bacteriovoracaceae bacterium]
MTGKNLTKFLVVSLLGTVLLGLWSCTEEAVSEPQFIFKPAPNKTTAAKFGDVEINYDELHKGVESELYEARMKVYEIEMNRLQGLLIEKIIEKDPKKKGLSNDEYLDKYIAKDMKVSEQDIQKFVKERNIPKNQIEKYRPRIIKFLEMENKKKAVDLWLAKQTKKTPVEVYLKKPSRPVFNVRLGKAPFTGDATAKVTLVEFSDFQCPYCAKGAKIIDDLKKKYGKKLKIVFKHFPLHFHKDAKLAAEASLCAHEQKPEAFWKMHDEMFADQAGLKINGLKAKAKKIGLKMPQFNKCLESGTYRAQVEEDMKDGEAAGVRSTPTFYVNGKMINGAQPVEVFSEIIDAEFAKK